MIAVWLNGKFAIFAIKNNSLSVLQLESGLWSNILTNPDTFPETSASAMFMTGLSRGLR